MSNESDVTRSPKINRRDLLSTAAALPVAAALAPQALLAQQRRPSGAGARDPIRVGIIGAGGSPGTWHPARVRDLAATPRGRRHRHCADRHVALHALNAGAIYELMMRWLGPGNRVRGTTRVHVPTRRDEQGNEHPARIPDHVEVLYELANGAPVHMTFSETTGLSRGNDTWIFGSEGTIHIDNAQKIFVGRRGDRELVEHQNPPEGQYRHRVEEKFINAIRGIEAVSMNTFEIGVRYMEWTEAIYRSAESGAVVSLPLAV